MDSSFIKRNLSPTNSAAPFVQTKKDESKSEEAQDERPTTVKAAVKEWCDDTTCHGFRNLVNTDSWVIRISWIVLLALSIGYCTYTIEQSIATYFEYGVTVSYYTVSESPTKFPKIMICNMNPFDVSSTSYAGDYVNTALSTNGVTADISLSSGETAYSAVYAASETLKAAITANTTINDTFLENIGFTMKTMLVSCYFNGEECNYTDFKWYRTNEYGNCYLFNYDSDNAKYTSRTGPDSGLSMELFLGVTSQSYYTITTGAYLIVSNQSIVPLVKYEGISLEAGTSSSIAVSRTFYTRLSSPYSDCRKDLTVLSSDSTYFQITSNMTQYYQNFCYEICFQYEYAIQSCGCQDPSIPIYDDSIDVCTNLTCVKALRTQFDSTSLSDSCDQYCPLECDSITYDTSVSTASYPSNYYSNILTTQDGLSDKFTASNTFTPKDNGGGSNQSPGRRRRDTDTLMNLPHIRHKRDTTNSSNSTNSTGGSSSTTTVDQSQIEAAMLMFTVYYNEMEYTSIEESAALDSTTLIGVIGGQFGLFVGASFLSFAEILELFYEIARILIKRYRKQNSRVAHSIMARN